jgi:hypothetical protein
MTNVRRRCIKLELRPPTLAGHLQPSIRRLPVPCSANPRRGGSGSTGIPRPLRRHEPPSLPTLLSRHARQGNGRAPPIPENSSKLEGKELEGRCVSRVSTNNVAVDAGSYGERIGCALVVTEVIFGEVQHARLKIFCPYVRRDANLRQRGWELAKFADAAGGAFG